MNNKLRTSSLIAALSGWLLLSALNVFIIWALRDRARLVRDNDNERTINTLFTEMRNFSDFDSAIEANPLLKERITGAAIYDGDMQPVSQWGKVPPVFDEKMLEGSTWNRFGRYTIPDRQGRSAKFVLRYDRKPPQPPDMHRQGGFPPGLPPPQAVDHGNSQPESSAPEGGNFPFRQERRFAEGGQMERDMRGRYFYTDILHPAYWRTRTLTAALFPLIEIFLLALIFYIRRLYLQGCEYREKIESQQNLVVLGTAAGTLAHEIKNPLLSIRLQTGILEKTGGDAGRDEIRIINQEVERLSALIYRVQDYLREPGGDKAPVNITRLAAETSKRLCGADSIDTGDGASSDAYIFADENRIRSVLENVIRNAVDSGSALGDITMRVAVEGQARTGAGQNVVLRIFDRGGGIAPQNLARAFDPFFTTKSTGTGIGLAISRRFTEAAGGTISLENRSDGGLAVTLVFPLYDKDSK
jgi:two-component system sensor histidine kinase HydH